MLYTHIVVAALIGCPTQSAHAQEAVPSVGRMVYIPDARERPRPKANAPDLPWLQRAVGAGLLLKNP